MVSSLNSLRSNFSVSPLSLLSLFASLVDSRLRGLLGRFSEGVVVSLFGRQGVVKVRANYIDFKRSPKIEDGELQHGMK